jgi:FkbM family methyltransferase
MKELIKNIIPYKTRMKLRFIQHQLFPTKEDVIETKQFSARYAFYKHILNEGDICFDIGANTGNRTGVFVSLGAKVVAVEPQQELCKYLDAKFGRRITLVHKGVGDKEGKMTLHSPAKYSALATFSKEWIEQGRFKGDGWKETETVEITTLDLLIQQFGLPKFIKIDTEGYEAQVMKGLSYKIPYLSFEYMTPELNQQAIECIEMLKKINNNVICNFSAQESMRFNLETWLTPDQMIEYIHTQEFIKTDFGDLYVKSIT